jgi:poly-beta-1,6-N-acetyl-D-glucosamine synthase
VLGLYRRDRVLAVGGYDPWMATEDIELTWRLLLAGWETVYEPRALVGMQVPSTVPALWAQRTRWAPGQGEVLHVHLSDVSRWRNHRMWLLSIEALASLIWVIALVVSLVIAALGTALGGDDLFGFAFAWGIAIAVVATIQLMVALTLEREYDATILRALLVAAVYPLLYWILAAAAALHSQTVALVRGPRERRVVWDIPRERLEPNVASATDTPSQDH